MYVAVTRARQRLYLSFAQSRMLHGQTRYNLRSRFLEEIPAVLTKCLTPPKVRGHAAEPAFKRYFDPAPARAAAPSMAPPPPQPSRDLGGLRVGQNVTHARFGMGVIVDVVPNHMAVPTPLFQNRARMSFAFVATPRRPIGRPMRLA